jgi:adenylate cyclase
MAVARVERRLAAILAADIVGYSRLIGVDEALSLGAVKALWTDLIDQLIADHNGRIAKLMGDEAIVEFGSVVDAVACAVASQKALADRAATPSDPLRVFPIGINLGDVVVDIDDVLGDGVIVAARLEQLCAPSDVLVTGTAYDQLQGKLDVALDFVGEHHVKSISGRTS